MQETENKEILEGEILFNDDYDKTDEITERKIGRNLDIKKYDRMIIDIIESIKEERIILDPDYQRNYIWDNSKASKLVESILLNIPIPIIYASEERNHKWAIIDGLQRLYSLKRFYDDEFKLSGLEILGELNGRKYSDLPENIRMIVDRGDLSIILLLYTSDPEIQYDIFVRLNTGAVHLNEQELRNCLFRGSLNNYLKEVMVHNEYFKKIFNLEAPSKRMSDVESILRYLAFSEYYQRSTGEIRYYEGGVKHFLNHFMRNNQDVELEKLEQLNEKFSETMKKAWEVFGNAAFRKKDSAEPINRPLYDCVMLSLEEYDLVELISKKEEIIEKAKILVEDPVFNNYISLSTGNSKKVIERIKAYREMLMEIMKK